MKINTKYVLPIFLMFVIILIGCGKKYPLLNQYLSDVVITINENKNNPAVISQKLKDLAKRQKTNIKDEVNTFRSKVSGQLASINSADPAERLKKINDIISAELPVFSNFIKVSMEPAFKDIPEYNDILKSLLEEKIESK